MKKITGRLALQLKELVIDHLQGEALHITAARLQFMVEGQQRGGRDLFESVDVAFDDPFVRAIMASLALPEGSQTKFASEAFNLWEFLEALQDPYVALLVKTVDTTHPTRRGLWLLTGAGLAAGIGAAFQQGLFKGLGATLSQGSQALLARALPLVNRFRHWPYFSALLEGAGFFASLLTTPRLSLGQRLVKAGQSALTMAGFTLWALAGSLTPVAATCLIAVAAMKFAEATFARLLHPKVPTSATNWQEAAFNLRQDWLRQDLNIDLLRRGLHTAVTASTLSLMLINPALSLPGLLLLTLSPLVEAYASQQLKAASLSGLQSNLRAIELAPDASLCPSTKPQGLALLQGLSELRVAKAQVADQEARLLQREEAVNATLSALRAGKLPVVAVNEEPIDPQVVAANEDELQDNPQVNRL